MDTSNETDPLVNEITSGLTCLHEWVHQINEKAGWNDPQRTFGEDIALIHSEASEALEAFRETGDPTDRWYTYTTEVEAANGPITLKNLTEDQLFTLTRTSPESLGLKGKPEGCGAELADVIIRAVHAARMHGIDIAAEVVEKVEYNSTRAFRHGGKHL